MGSFSFLNIASGSKGNATLIYTDKQCFLVDMGLTKKALTTALSSIDRKLNDIDAVFITHRHNDHMKGYPFVEHIPTYGRDGVIDYDINAIDEYSSVQIGDVKVTCIPTSHDAPSPAGYIFFYEDKKLVYITDTGRLNKPVLAMISNADAYIMESNYDPDLLEHSGRPRLLINRIKSTKGHLSNEKSASYLAQVIGPKTKQVFLAHLSEECNDPKIALDVHYKIYGYEKHIDIIPLKQWVSSQGNV